MRIRSVLSHSAQVVVEGALISLLVVGLAAGTAFAAKPAAGTGGHNGGGSITGGGTIAYQMVTDVNGNNAPNWGDTVTFKISTTATEPNVDLTCSQGGTVVYSATTGFYASYPWPWTHNMTLSSQMWTGQSASCVARLYVFAGSRTSTLATQSFTAGA